MLKALNITVHAVPVAQPRPRAVAVNGRARVYGAPAKSPVHEFKAAVRRAALEAMGDVAPTTSHVALAALFVFPRPRALHYKTRLMPRVPHAKKPDMDNLLKSVCDALTGVVWHDDRQVWRVQQAEKVIAAHGERPRVELSLWWEDLP